MSRDDAPQLHGPRGPLAYPGPVDLLPEGRELLPRVWERRLFWAFLALGIAARFIRYALRFPLWEDECFLVLNLADRGYSDLLMPLDCHQAAPLLFLWVELAVVKLLGYSEMALRLVPQVASAAGLLVAAHVARRLTKGTALLVAVAVLSVAYPSIRYAAEAKQYGTNLLAAVVLIALAVEWWRRPDRLRWLWLLALAGPVAVGLGYPGVLVAGGVGLFVAAVLIARRARRAWLPWAVYCLLAAAAFGGVYLAAEAQRGEDLGYMQRSWGHAFPPVLRPWELPAWFVVTHAGEALAYPAGSENGGSSLTFLLCLAGAAGLAWRRRWGLMLLVLAPAAMQFAAAAVRQYPYGGHPKFAHHHALPIALLFGLGASLLLRPLAGRPPHGRRVLAALLIVLACVGAGSIVRDVANPWKTKSDLRARAFARWFWVNRAHEAELVSAEIDLGEEFAPGLREELTWGAQYLVYANVCSPRLRAGRTPDWGAVSAEHPLRVTVYRTPLLPFDRAARDAWLAEIQRDYELTGRRVYAFPRRDKRERMMVARDLETGKPIPLVDRLEVYDFVPRE